MRIESLKTFIEVVDKGSLLSAAKSLGMSVSTVSMQIGNVEKFFNAKLLERTASGVKVTKEGELASQSIRDLLERLDRSKKLIESIRSKNIKIAIDCVVVPLIAKLQAQYRQMESDANISIKLRSSSTCFKLLDSGEVSIIIVGYLSSHPNRAKYVVKEIGKDKLVLLVPMNHELATKEEIYIKDVLSYPMVTLSSSYGITSKLEEALTKETLKGKELIMECSVDDVFSQIYGVSAGLGTAIASYILSAKYEEGGLLRIREIKDFTEKRPIYAICHRPALHNPEVSKFFEFLVEKGEELIKDYKV
jgi:DNA-binding transcriptional LysR family regulator